MASTRGREGRGGNQHGTFREQPKAIVAGVRWARGRKERDAEGKEGRQTVAAGHEGGLDLCSNCKGRSLADCKQGVA